jgi:hypothetical protein
MKGILSVKFLVGLSSILLVFFASPALSESSPVYLKCEMEVDGTMAPFTVTLNESTNKVVHEFESGKIIDTIGVFTIDDVTYDDKLDMSIGYLASKFRINRVDLSFQRVSLLVVTHPLMSDSPPNKPTTTLGTCKVEKIPDRAF